MIRFEPRGDFWNYTGDQAAKVARILGLTLQQSASGTPMVGIPAHALPEAKVALKKAGISASFKVRMKPETLKQMRMRKKWRQSALSTTNELVTWPCGKPGREGVEQRVCTALRKVQEYFGGRSGVVSMAIQRRAIRTFNTLNG